MNNKKETITGMSLKGEAILVYLISLLGFIFSFMKDEVNKEARWVYNQAGAAWIVNIALSVFGWVLVFIPVVGVALVVVSRIATFVLFVFEIIAIVKAYNGEHYEIPLVSNLAKTIWKNDSVSEAKYEEVKETKKEIKKETKEENTKEEK